MAQPCTKGFLSDRVDVCHYQKHERFDLADISIMMGNVGIEENRIADFENVELRLDRNFHSSLADH